MSRVLIEVEINGCYVKALMDPGVVSSYVERKIIPPDLQVRKRITLTCGLGGRIQTIEEECLLEGKIQGLEFSTDCFVVEELGKLEPEGIEFEILLGARMMEKYGIKIDPRKGEIELEGLKRREFTEFFDQIKNNN